MPDPIDLVTKAQVETFLNANNPAFNTSADQTLIPGPWTYESDGIMGWFNIGSKKSPANS